EKNGPSLEELLRDRVYADARLRGRARVLAALEDGEVPARPLGDASSTAELLEELLSHAYARILVSALADGHVVRRHALAEAVRARGYLLDETPETIADCARAVGLGFEADGEELATHFAEYLKMSV